MSMKDVALVASKGTHEPRKKRIIKGSSDYAKSVNVDSLEVLVGGGFGKLSSIDFDFVTCVDESFCEIIGVGFYAADDGVKIVDDLRDM